ncbi:hypothetical protein ACVIGB_005275 [Bradyrhizobium sp. USDA 4341]
MSAILDAIAQDFSGQTRHVIAMKTVAGLSFLGARHLLNSIPNKEKTAIEGSEVAFLDRPGDREAELTRRSEERLKQTEVSLRPALPDAHFEIHRAIGNATCAELLALHRQAFPEYASVDEQYYAERMRQ